MLLYESNIFEESLNRKFINALSSIRDIEKNIIVVDEKYNIINLTPRNLVDEKGLRYRVSALWVTDSKGRILLAQRVLTKRHNPGKWGRAVAGTVEEGG